VNITPQVCLADIVQNNTSKVICGWQLDLHSEVSQFVYISSTYDKKKDDTRRGYW
jgi:hypothetical protein